MTIRSMFDDRMGASRGGLKLALALIVGGCATAGLGVSKMNAAG